MAILDESPKSLGFTGITRIATTVLCQVYAKEFGELEL